MKTIRRTRIIVTLLTSCAIFAALVVVAGDQQASEAFQSAIKKYKSGDYLAAAKLFLNAEHHADTVSMKADAVKEAVKCYNRAKLYWKEFENIEKLLVSYPSHIDYAAMVDREYEIGNAYFSGHRDPAFWHLRWIPWLTGPDKTITIFEKALKHAPFAKSAPSAKLRLAVLLLESDKIDDALTQLREVIKQYPKTKACKFAYLELGNALFQLSRKGDGDGKYNQETLQVFKQFLKEYPKASEREWVQKCLLKSTDIQAARLLNIAKFYHRIGREQPAERYLNEVLKKYPDSESADNSEEILTEIDKTYVPEGFRPELKSRIPTYQVMSIPAEPSPIIVVPENSGHKWLLPIRDLGIGNRHEPESASAKKEKK